MTVLELRPEHIAVFSDTVCEFFDSLCGEPAQVRSAYLLEDARDPILWNDFHGLIVLSGGYVGTVCFSASRNLLTHVLLLSGEGKYDDDQHLDIVGEIANQFAGRARRKFGGALEISTPIAFAGRSRQVPRQAESAPYAIPFSWRGYDAGLVVNLEPHRKPARTAES
jgi:chemotaxis protein CheX